MEDSVAKQLIANQPIFYRNGTTQISIMTFMIADSYTEYEIIKSF